MKCPKCRSENPDDAKFCIECASPLEYHCPNCGAITPVTGKFCKECAYDLSEPKEAPSIDYSEPQSYTPKFLADKILTNRSSIEGERKLVTVLFADVSDYTSMAEKLDPEAIVAEMVKEDIYTSYFIAPELVIINGNKTLNGFLLWDISDSMIYFTGKHWPEFDVRDFKKAVDLFGLLES